MESAALKNYFSSLFLIFVTLFVTQFANSKEVQIIEMRKNLALRNDEKIQTDYFLNAGTELGIKPGTLFTLYRRLSVLDRFGGTQARPLSVPVGKIKIIYTAKNISVARLSQLDGFDNLPSLEYRSVMLGDIIHVGSAEISEESKNTNASLGVIPEDLMKIIPEPQNPRLELRASSYEIPQKLPVENTQNSIQRGPASSPMR